MLEETEKINLVRGNTLIMNNCNSTEGYLVGWKSANLSRENANSLLTGTYLVRQKHANVIKVWPSNKELGNEFSSINV